jgi:hypothetical protein
MRDIEIGFTGKEFHGSSISGQKAFEGLGKCPFAGAAQICPKTSVSASRRAKSMTTEMERTFDDEGSYFASLTRLEVDGRAACF